MRFKNITQGNFSFRGYLLVKYNGFFPEGMETWKELSSARKEAMLLPKWEKNDAVKKFKSRKARYDKVMGEWARLQK